MAVRLINIMPYLSTAKKNFEETGNGRGKPICRIPDDWIDNKSYPLFMGRLVMSELIMQFSRPSILDSSFVS